MVEILLQPGVAGSAATLRVSERDSVFADWLAGQGARVVLVRPDHYAYGCAHDAAGLNALVRALAQSLLADVLASTDNQTCSGSESLTP